MSLAAGTRLGPYEVLGLIGSGGMGEVYKARDTRLDRTVAIKILPVELSADSDRRTRFALRRRMKASVGPTLVGAKVIAVAERDDATRI